MTMLEWCYLTINLQDSLIYNSQTKSLPERHDFCRVLDIMMKVDGSLRWQRGADWLRQWTANPFPIIVTTLFFR